jgi:hypothetical protein
VIPLDLGFLATFGAFALLLAAVCYWPSRRRS